MSPRNDLKEEDTIPRSSKMKPKHSFYLYQSPPGKWTGEDNWTPLENSLRPQRCCCLIWWRLHLTFIFIFLVNLVFYHLISENDWIMIRLLILQNISQFVFWDNLICPSAHYNKSLSKFDIESEWIESSVEQYIQSRDWLMKCLLLSFF